MRTATYANEDGPTKSRRAIAAEQEGRYPMTVCAQKIGICSAAFRAGCAAVNYIPTEWHHTGLYARRTDYYDLASLTTQERFWRGVAASYGEKRGAEILASVGIAPLTASEAASEHETEIAKCTARCLEFVVKYGAEFVVQNEAKQRLGYNTAMHNMGLFEGYDAESNMRSMHSTKDAAEAHMARWQSRCPEAKLRIVTVIEDMLTGRFSSGGSLPLYGCIGGKFTTLATIDLIRVELKTALYQARKSPVMPQRDTQKNWDVFVKKQCSAAGVRLYDIAWEVHYYPAKKDQFFAALAEQKKIVDARKKQEADAAEKKAKAKARFEARMKKHGLSYCESRKGTTGLTGDGILIYPDHRDRRVCWFNGGSRTIRRVWREVCDKTARVVREELQQHLAHKRNTNYEPLPAYIRMASEVKSTGQVWSENEMRWRNCGPLAVALWHATYQLMRTPAAELLKLAKVPGRTKLLAAQKAEAAKIVAADMAQNMVFDPCI